MKKESDPVIVGFAGRGISVRVFENEAEKGNYHTAQISRPYEDKSGETIWQQIRMPADDLLLLAEESLQVFRDYKKIKRKS